MAIDGINEANVTAWLGANVDGVTPPLTFDLIAGGHSNLTFGVTDARNAQSATMQEIACRIATARTKIRSSAGNVSPAGRDPPASRSLLNSATVW